MDEVLYASDYNNGETWTKSYLQTDYSDTQSDYTDLKNSLVNGARKLVTPLEKIQEENINEEMIILNRKGGKFLTRLYGNNEEFREEIINFVRDKKELDLELILDKRSKTNTLNTLGNKYLAECITSKDNTKDLIEIMAKYYLRSSLVNHEQSSLEKGKPCCTNHEQSSFTDLRNDQVNIIVYPIINAFKMFRV